jgi:hypothetical protein
MGVVPDNRRYLKDLNQTYALLDDMVPTVSPGTPYALTPAERRSDSPANHGDVWFKPG